MIPPVRAIIGYGTHSARKFVIGCKHRSGIAKSTYILCGVEAERGSIAKRACRPPVTGCSPYGLRIILHQYQPVTLYKLSKTLVIARTPVEMHRQDCFHFRSISLVKQARIHIERVGISVDKYRFKARVRNSENRRYISVGRHNYGIALLQTPQRNIGSENHAQCVEAVANAHGERHARSTSKRLLEAFHLGSAYIAAGFHHPAGRLFQLGKKRLVNRPKVKKRILHTALVRINASKSRI